MVRDRTGALLLALAVLVPVVAGCASPSTSGTTTGTGASPPSAVATQPSAGQTVSGFLNTKSDTPLPADATAIVKLQDNSDPDAATATLGEQTLQVGGKTSPIDFAIGYDVSRVEPTHLIAVHATITSAGSTLFVNKGETLVITQGRPTTNVGVVMTAP